MRNTVDTADRLVPGRHVRAVVTPQGGALLDLRPRRGRWYTLTSAAGFWWQRIQAGYSIAEASQALSWKLSAPVFQELRAHPAVAGALLEAKRLELKQDRRWSKK